MVLLSSLLKIWTLNTNRVGIVKAVFVFENSRLLSLQKTLLINFPEKWLKYYCQSVKFYGILPKETRENSISVWVFCAHFDVLKYRARADYLRFHCACDRKTVGNHLNFQTSLPLTEGPFRLKYSQIQINYCKGRCILTSPFTRSAGIHIVFI